MKYYNNANILFLKKLNKIFIFYNKNHAINGADRRERHERNEETTKAEKNYELVHINNLRKAAHKIS